MAKKLKTEMSVEQKIAELRLNVQMNKDAYEGLLKDYNRAQPESDARDLVAAMLLGARKGMKESYDEIVRLITPIVEAAPESRVKIEGVKDEEEAARLCAFWKSYVEHPDASEKLSGSACGSRGSGRRPATRMAPGRITRRRKDGGRTPS